MENQLPFYLSTLNPLTPEVTALFEKAYNEALKRRNEFITPEHLLYVLIDNPNFLSAMECVDGDVEKIKNSVEKYFETLDKVPENLDYDPVPSIQFMQLARIADKQVYSCGKSSVEITHIVKALSELEDSNAAYILNEEIGGNIGYFLMGLIGEVLTETIDEEEEEDFEIPLDFPIDNEEINESIKSVGKKGKWKDLVVCLNDIYSKQNPLIGREEELKKTIRVLCRKEKNNPLHLGEPGVGKTALVYGLTQMIEEGRVPEKLKGAKVYRLDLGSLIAGTQYRGDFEKRIKTIMDGAANEQNAIIYIDEIHNLVGAGAIGDSSMDASNILKPYLETGQIRFIGATTYDEYKRYFARSKSIVRRFSTIDIPEPTVEETINILNQLKPLYEEYHGVEYSDDAIKFAAEGSSKHLNDRFLPDKAIDLIDESGAELQLKVGFNKQEGKETENLKGNIVDKALVSNVLAKMCKVDSIAESSEESQDLYSLERRISSQLFGQDQAIKEVTESILMAKAGLEEDNKPLASLLFVGPTGVGKTELAKLLSKEMGIELIRFDMSEYTEKHAVAKFIGSPAGYVGYEDGGQLTDAIRKNPNSVLLLDEIEKAHPDIYNILLQVMDYAQLTDNKGNKADFRNVVLIMTSNAGAQYAKQASVGFASRVSQGDAMLREVKKTFKPEFINRLSATVVFNDMSREMASLILDKKLNELKKKLQLKKVELNISEKAREYLLNKGFTQEYGARELDRVIQHELKRELMKEILFGKAKDGGKLTVEEDNGKLIVRLSEG